VLEFGPASVLEVCLNIGKAHGVESHVTGHGSVQLFGSDQERDGFGHFLGVQGDRSGSLSGLVVVMMQYDEAKKGQPCNSHKR
jgi:hypothetical protein